MPKVNKFIAADASPPDQSNPYRAVVVAEFDPFGGPYKNLLRIVKTLVNSGYSVDFFPTRPDYPELSSMSYETGKLRIHSFFERKKKLRGPLKIIGYLLEARFLAKWLRAQSINQGVMVFSVTSPGRFLWRYPKTLRQVYILRSDPEGPLHRMAGPWFRLLASPKTSFLGVSEATTRKLASSWGFRRSDERLEYLRNPGAVEGEPLPTFSGTTKQILMVGRVHESKNPFFWLDVAKGVISEASERLRFVWLGDGALRAKAIAYAEKIGIGHLVSFPGFTRDPYPVYRESFLYLHLARTEPLGNAVVDAQAFGIPSVVSAIGGLPEIVVDGLNGRTVEIESITPAVDAVIEIIENRQTHLRMSLAARKLFEERFSGGVWEEQFLDKIGHGSIP